MVPGGFQAKGAKDLMPPARHINAVNRPIWPAGAPFDFAPLHDRQEHCTFAHVCGPPLLMATT